METADDRAAIRERSLAAHGLTEADMFDHRRPTVFSAEKNRARQRALVAESAEDAFFRCVYIDDENYTIPAWLGALTPQQRAVMILRFGLGAWAVHTQQEAADALGVTQPAVAQHEAAARARLADHLGDPQQLNAVL